MLRYYSSIILISWMALLSLSTLIHENAHIAGEDKQLLYLTQYSVCYTDIHMKSVLPFIQIREHILHRAAFRSGIQFFQLQEHSRHCDGIPQCPVGTGSFY